MLLMHGFCTLYKRILGRHKIDVINSIMLLIKRFCIGSVTGLRSAVLVRGRSPSNNTADQGPVTKPIRNHLINDIIQLLTNEELDMM